MSMFGEVVRWRRLALGLTQAELAARIKVRHRPTTASYICRIEGGTIDPSLSLVRSLARALTIKPWQLLACYDTTEWWSDYLHLGPTQKRDVQGLIKYYSERRR